MTDVLDTEADDFSDVLAEEVAAAPLTGSRGTRRKRGAASASDDAPPAPRVKRVGVRLERKLNELQARLSGEMFTVGTMVGLPLPVTGYYIAQESDRFTKAIVELASKKPEWVEALENVASIAPGLVIGRTALGVGTALAVDRERIDIAKRETMLRFLGVWTAIEEVKGGGIGGDFKPAEGSRYTPPPKRSFVPVQP